MATKQLDFIATCSLADRKKVMPRIRCKNGVSFSAQASIDHLSLPWRSEPPWTSLEVAFLAGTSIPKDWKPVSSRRHEAFERHDTTSLGAIQMQNASVYVIEVDKLRAFIEMHGGEVEGQEPQDELHARIVALRDQTERKWMAFELVKEKERTIWDDRIRPVILRVPTEITQEEAEQLILGKFSGDYGRALKEAQRLFDEWLALSEECAALMQQELVELEREIQQAT